MTEMRFGRVARLSPSEYSRWQSLVRQAQDKRAFVVRPEVEGEPFRLFRYGEELHTTDQIADLERALETLE